jgi:diguanylate cyclase (GGDEF)-like protein/PAS domain S-box-containing protein
VATGVLVVAAMIVAVERARANAERHRRAEVLVETIRGDSQQLNAIRAQGLADAEAFSARRQVDVNPALIVQGVGAWTQLSSALTQLGRLDPAVRTARLNSDAQELYALGVRDLTLTGRRSTAQLHGDQARFAAEVDRLNADAQIASAYERRVADGAARDADTEFVVSLLIGLVALLAIGWRFHALRRRLAVEAARHAAETAGEARLRALLEQSSDVITVVNPDLTIQWQAASVTAVLGHAPETLVGRPLCSLAHPEDAPLLERFLASSLARGDSHSLTVRFAHVGGGWRTLESVVQNRVSEPAIGGLVLSMRDVTERQALEDQLRHQAFHDPLTGLANRSLFENRLTQALSIARRNGQVFAVLFLDLDDFKTINDSLGHHRGDDLLRAVAQRIASTLRPVDTAARLGGDEFAVLIDLADDAEMAALVAERIRRAVAAPFEIGDRQLRVTASMGLALSRGVASAEELLRNADMAMYAAKADGKAALRTFEAGMHRRAVERLELTGELRAALDSDQFVLEYQPIVSLDRGHDTGRIVGAEALVRWEHPARGRISPDQFIGLAEDTGLIVPLGRWILRTACEQRRQWGELFPDEALQLSVNVSTRQLHEPDFVDTVREVLHDTALPRDALTLEITEGVLAGDRSDVVARLEELKHEGVRVAVDDFGTGYSSLSHLSHLPIDTLKIDRSFMQGIEHDPAKANLVRGIVNLGASLELAMIAEGIEQPGQADEFGELAPPLGQGFLFFPPLPPGEIERLLAAQGGREPAAV